MLAGAEPLRLPVESLPAGLEAGSVLEDAQWQALARESAYALLLARALRLLERREHFVAELRRKLFTQGQDSELVQRVLARCLELGYLDDARALKLYLDQISARGGIGPARLRQLLFEHGCPPALIDRALEEFSAHFDEAVEATALLEKRRRHFASRLTQLRRREEARRLRAAQKLPQPWPDEAEAANAEPASGEAQAAAPLSPAAARAQALKLRVQLAAAVLSFLHTRGLSGDSSRRAAQRLVSELLEEGGTAAGED